ncbi:MAG: glycerate kinase, partial [Acidimicrobiia bacterium]
MRIAIVCPDKFRGTLTAPEAADAIATGLARAGFDEVRRLPLADGGEGTLDALLAARGGGLRT